MAIDCKKTITKYGIVLNNKPKIIHKRILKLTTNAPLDCLKDRNINILIHPQDIPQERWHSQQISFQKQPHMGRSRGVHPLLYFAYTCIRDLFIGGLFTLQKKIIRYGVFQNKGVMVFYM